jgi:hypothetical protein
MVSAIFSINTGRSGSHYLARLLSFAENCDSHHESEPSGFGRPLIEYHRGNPRLMQQVAREKLAQVEAARRNGRIFADTNHCFIKGFGESLVSGLPESEVGIIFLTRDRAQIVDSTFKVFSLPLTPRGRTYIFTPERRNPILPPPAFAGLPGRLGYRVAYGVRLAVAGWRRLVRGLTGRPTVVHHLAAYQKACIGWYVDETGALGRQFRDRHPACRYFEIDIEQLNDPDVVRSLFDAFGLRPTEALWAEIGKPTNLKTHEKL